MTLYCVICKTVNGDHPWIEIVTEFQAIAEQEVKFQIDQGVFAQMVEKQLNLYPVRK